MHEQVNCGEVEGIKVLLVGDSPADARMVRLALSEAPGPIEVRQCPFTVTRVGRLAAALKLLGRKNFSVVLLDLQLPEPDALDALAAVCTAAADVPVVVLIGADDDGQALCAIQRGAQDYVAKDHLDGRLLRRTIRHAIERKRAEGSLLRRTLQLEAAYAHIEQQAKELRARAEQLDQINRELDGFTYLASHDLKEPLRGIRAYCETLWEDYRDKLDADGQHRLNTLINLCNRLETLIGDLLTYCRVGGARSADTAIELGAVLGDVLATLQPAIDRRNASVRVVDRLPVVSGDATLIGMALGNLIANGLKFNDRPQPHVEIGCLSDDPPTLYVRDDGIGIEEQHHEAIFTIFRRLHSRKKYEGTGAGLTIVRKIIESHGGRIWLKSQPGAGSTFFFTLAPARKKPTAEPVTRPPHWVEHPYGKARQHEPLYK